MSMIINWRTPSTKRIILSYLPDWILVIVFAATFLAIGNISGFRRRFSLADITIMYPYSPEDTVPMWAIICLVVPIIIIAIIAVAVRRSLADLHSGILGLCLGLSLCSILTDVVKITVGRPRPDLIARCQPAAGSLDPILGLSDYTVCTTSTDSHELIDGFKSFPSGHTSFSFAGLIYLSLYLAGKMHLFDGQGHTYKAFVFSVPIICALLVGISRVHDYKHHWQDVLCSVLLGTTCAYFAYRQYYPDLGSHDCGLPFDNRIDLFKDDPNSDDDVYNYYVCENPDFSLRGQQRQRRTHFRAATTNTITTPPLAAYLPPNTQ